MTHPHMLQKHHHNGDANFNQQPNASTLKRRRAFLQDASVKLIPHEHGAWGIFTMPFVSGATLAKPSTALAFTLILLLMVTGVCMMMSRTALMGMFRYSHDLNRYRAQFIAFYALCTVVAVCGIIVLVHRLWLATIIPLLVVVLWLDALASSKRQTRTPLMRVIEMMALTGAAPIAYYVASNRISWFMLALWLIWLSYYLVAIPYVRSHISYNRGDMHRAYRYGMMAVLLSAIAGGVLPCAVAWLKGGFPLTSIPLVIAFGRSIWVWFKIRRVMPKTNLRAVGWFEVALSGLTAVTLMLDLWHVA